MRFIGWMYDIAREQSPREDVLEEMLRRSRDAGYNAVAFYLEHRFAYASAPWAAGPGCLTAEVVKRIANRFREEGLRVIPFLNTLGHMEGFLRAEGGQRFAEGPSQTSQQMCPSRPECSEFARALVRDAMDAFDDEWIHLGGDETRQLGQCPLCAQRVERIGKAGLYAEYFAPLCRWVLESGRRPCLWGDMLIAHPETLDAIPRDTIIFDWQYEHRPRESTRMFRERGFDVVCCPSVQTYNSAWCFLDRTQRNIDEHAQDAREFGALGVLVTTWEFRQFTQYATMLPLIYAVGRRLAHDEDWHAALVREAGESYARAADVLGNKVPAAAEFLAPETWRQLRDRLVIRSNPFKLWQDWRSEACGKAGDAILRLCDEAANVAAGALDVAAGAPAGRRSQEASEIVKHRREEDERSTAEPLQFAIDLHRVAVRWVRLVEQAYRHYAASRLTECVAELKRGHELLERLRPGLHHAAELGGSTADVARLDLLQSSLERVCARIAALPQKEACRPTFETLVHDAYIPGDQAAWRTGNTDES